MGKTRPPERNKRNKKTAQSGMDKASKSPSQLLSEAGTLLQCGQPQAALGPARKALKALRQTANALERLPALGLLGEISVELGEVEAGRAYFLEAAEIDAEGTVPEERGGGPEKFFWLAQLSEEGGLDSVSWYERGADVSRRQIADMLASSSPSAAAASGAVDGGEEEEMGDADAEGEEGMDPALDEARLKLASALCGIAEVYMTDLSFDDEAAEEACNRAITEALSVAPDSPQTLQTAASVRISQLRQDEARQLLKTSLELWKDLEPGDASIPDFATRISLARLLMEAELEEEGIEVLERLVREDDQSVEAWYLGGWCLQLLADKEKASREQANPVEEEEELLRRSRTWLKKALEIYTKLDYEDERLRDHALELVAGLNAVFGEPLNGEKDGDNDDEEEAYWVDEQTDEDQEMEQL